MGRQESFATAYSARATRESRRSKDTVKTVLSARVTAETIRHGWLERDPNSKELQLCWVERDSYLSSISDNSDDSRPSLRSWATGTSSFTEKKNIVITYNASSLECHPLTKHKQMQAVVLTV